MRELVSTGLIVWFTRSSLMLPLKKCASPFLPYVLMHIMSASILVAKFIASFNTFVIIYVNLIVLCCIKALKFFYFFFDFMCGHELMWGVYV